MEFERSSGILLHPTSLPGPHGVGTLGAASYEFVDYLVQAGQSLWQTLPMGPTGFGNSPYQCFSAFAGNPLLIDLDMLANDALLTRLDLKGEPRSASRRVNFAAAEAFKTPVLRAAYQCFRSDAGEADAAKFARYRARNSDWLEDYALFMALKDKCGGSPWFQWPAALRRRRPGALDAERRNLSAEADYHAFTQYVFHCQWQELKAYANRNYIRLIGDIPLYVAHDSADVWTHPEIFQLDRNLRPQAVAGVPPDYFSKTGQLWGNPVYDWNRMAEEDFAWWLRRVESALAMSDIIRIDHFRGLSAYWSVPYGDKTAVNGAWIDAPGRELLSTLKCKLGDLPIIAEDLGVMTPDVEALRDDFGLSGMKILQFAFDAGEQNDYLPHTFSRNAVVYTGTHDNDTTQGWYRSASVGDKAFARAYTASQSEEDVVWDLVRLAWASVACMAIVPAQDLLGLGSRCRMNMPGTSAGNWHWRLKPGELATHTADRLRELTALYGR